MQITVKVIPQAKHNLVKEDGEVFKIYLTAPAVDGKANAALLKVLAQHFGVKRRQVQITKGLKLRVKTINIET